jgi:hypothetical protein
VLDEQFVKHFSNYLCDEEYYSLLKDCQQARLVLQTNPGLTYTFLEVLASALTQRLMHDESSPASREEEKRYALTTGQCPYDLREVLKTSGSIARHTASEVLKTSGPSTAQCSTHAEHMAHSSESKPSRSTSCSSLRAVMPLANPTQRPQPKAAFPVPASNKAPVPLLRNEEKTHEGQINSQAVIELLDRGSIESLTQTSHELEESHTLPPASSIGLSSSLNARVRVNASSSNPSSSQNIRVALPGPQSKMSESSMTCSPST